MSIDDPQPRIVTEERFREMTSGRGLTAREENALRAEVGLGCDENVAASHIEYSSREVLTAWQKVMGLAASSGHSLY